MRRRNADGSGPDPKGRAQEHPEPAGGRRRILSAARWRAWSAALSARLKLRLAETQTLFPVIIRVLSRMHAVSVLDAATRLAAQSFLTAIPLLFVVASFAPSGVRDQLLSSLRSVFGLTGNAESQVEQLLQPHDGATRDTVGAVGALTVLISATACSRAIQRLCRRAWDMPKTASKLAPWRWLAWIAAWLLILLVQGPLRDGFGLGLWLGVPLTTVCLTLAWWWTQHLLLGGAVRWPPLLPGAFLTAVALTVLSATARLYMPRALNRSLAEYGSVGSVFTMLSWLIVVCAAIAITITVGAVLAQEPWLARHLGPPEPAPAPLASPAPPRNPT
ncbi:YhjD/YihY/BrkB family envelope integrity protein [Streptomyces sp. NPDC020681]|uniref:YhjD/YihY/BrkB family envelope integrity protein n=1 Tax=Streptomyces sp. NPDC020681 TaxID=3365083 RepID=UPI003798CEA5